eukprot:symbB.v1.2.018962.t1/scaffold1533.1/size113312/5
MAPFEWARHGWSLFKLVCSHQLGVYPGIAASQEDQDENCCAGCSCDLSALHGIDGLMQRLGYDRCIDEGACEQCTGQEALMPLCTRTGRRQKVICTRCQGAMSYLPFCESNRIFWSLNYTANVSVEAPSAGLFLRSCSVPKTSRGRGHFFFGADGYEGSTEVIYFLCANALVLAASAWSLCRQQHQQWEKTMEGLYSCIEDGIPSASVGSKSGGKLELPRTRESKAKVAGKKPPGRWFFGR